MKYLKALKGYNTNIGTRGSMNEIKDRRSFDRLMNPEMTAFLINSSWYYFLRYKLFQSILLFIMQKTLLQNLSASGSCIVSTNNFEPGDAIHLIIYPPAEKSIFIKGSVRWISNDTMRNRNKVGIQFRAYGQGKRYNSYDILKQLRNYALQNKMLADNTDNKDNLRLLNEL